jgi:hypothetical protein
MHFRRIPSALLQQQSALYLSSAQDMRAKHHNFALRLLVWGIAPWHYGVVGSSEAGRSATRRKHAPGWGVWRWTRSWRRALEGTGRGHPCAADAESDARAQIKQLRDSLLKSAEARNRNGLGIHHHRRNGRELPTADLSELRLGASAGDARESALPAVSDLQGGKQAHPGGRAPRVSMRRLRAPR